MVLDVGGIKERFKKPSLGRMDLASEVARSLRLDGQFHITIPQARVLVDELMKVIELALVAGKRVEFREFGTLEPKRRRPTRTYCPIDEKFKKVDARWVVVFRTSPVVKKALMRSLEK